MTRTMLRDGYPTFSQFSAALRACRRATAIELRDLRQRPAIRRAFAGDRGIYRLAWRRSDAPQWALGVLAAALGSVPAWLPPVAPGRREACRRALLARIDERAARAWSMMCGEQDAMAEYDRADTMLAYYLSRYNYCRESIR